MVKCCAPRCPNASYRKTPEISFHRFPKDETLRQAWVKNINRKNWQPNLSSVLCSKHFEPSLITMKDYRTTLMPHAIPTIFKKEEQEQDKENVSLPERKTSRNSSEGLILHEMQVQALIPDSSTPTCSKALPQSASAASSYVILQDKKIELALKRKSCDSVESPGKVFKQNTEASTSVAVSQDKKIEPALKRKNFASVESPGKVFKQNTEASTSVAVSQDKKIEPTLRRKSFDSVDVHIQPTESPSKVFKQTAEASTSVVISQDKMIEPALKRKSFDSVESPGKVFKQNTEASTSVAVSQVSKKINKLESKIIIKNKKIKSLQEKNRRMKKKVQQFSQIIADLKKKLNEEEMSILSSIPVKNKDFMIRYLKKAKGSSLEKSYPPEIRSFALQLNFYSVRAYNFVRNHFNTVLPHTHTISRWYKKIDGQPGFTTESFNTLETLAKKSEHKIYVNLSIDEMAIKKEQVWDRSANRYTGFVDTGTEVADDSLPLATQALVLMVTAINACWKLPIAYFIISSMTGAQKANIVKMAIEMLYEINIFVCGLTFDGAASNISMATNLGCDFNLLNFKPYFYVKEMKIYAFYDPCHMLKLVRNCLSDNKVIIDKNGNKIEFEYLKKLQDLADQKGLHLGVKIKKAHIYFHKQKMKVRLASQLLSQSVSDALIFCKDILQIENFLHCEGTAQFVKMINDCFDVLNSRTTLAPGFKKALCNSNMDITKDFVQIASDYLINLKFLDGTKVINSARKTGFLGFIICLQNIINLYTDLFNSGGIKYLCSYKISQDHLEMFFGKMRARGGFNDNPNVLQFQIAYKKM